MYAFLGPFLLLAFLADLFGSSGPSRGYRSNWWEKFDAMCGGKRVDSWTMYKLRDKYRKKRLERERLASLTN